MANQLLAVLIVGTLCVLSQAIPPECELPADLSNRCQCALRLKQGINPSDPIYCHPNQSLVQCSLGDAEINCQFACSLVYRNFVNSSFEWTDPKPDDPSGRSWGQYFCDESRLAIGIAPEEDQCLELQMESAYRLTYCDDNRWNFVTDQPPKSFCCNQLGTYVDKCPPTEARSRSKDL